MMVMANTTNPDSVDELVVFGRRKVLYVFCKEAIKNNATVVQRTIKKVNLAGIKGGPKDNEKAYTCVQRIPGDSRYLIGSPSGYVFLCDGDTAGLAFRPHE